MVEGSDNYDVDGLGRGFVRIEKNMATGPYKFGPFVFTRVEFTPETTRGLLTDRLDSLVMVVDDKYKDSPIIGLVAETRSEKTYMLSSAGGIMVKLGYSTLLSLYDIVKE